MTLLIAPNSTTPELTITPGLDGNQSTIASIEAWLRQLTDDSWVEQARAIQAIQQEGASIVASLSQYLQHPEVTVRQGAVKALLQMRWIPGFRDTTLGYWLERSVVDILKELLRSDPSLLYAFLHDKDQRFREKVETIAWLKDTPPWCFTVVYRSGDHANDQSFDIEGKDGSYLGECGMVISEIAAGDPDNAMALEAWLFDKSDIRTVTKVLMSDYAYNNHSLREKLGSRGDAVSVQLGQRLCLETRTLEMEIKIVRLEYSVDGDQPLRSCFRRLDTELTIFERFSWQREYTATFVAGDQDYEESFDIETSDGSYMGECGMTISEVLVGDPDWVTAIEVWLFDKADIRTVNAVLMRDFAFDNQLLREKLAGRGDTVPAKLGQTFVLEAATLLLEGEITHLEYPEDAAAAIQFFQRLTVTMQVRLKAS